jgi:hypothetical protein
MGSPRAALLVPFALRAAASPHFHVRLHFMSSELASEQVVNQRIRSRIAEYLEMLVAYESDPSLWSLNETINQWEDWVRSPASEDQFPAPTYTQSECTHLIAVDRAWLAFADVTPQSLMDSVAEMKRPEWGALVQSAREALDVFMQRGRLPEDHEM